MDEKNVVEMLAEYTAMERAITTLQERKGQIEDEIKAFVVDTGNPVSGYGLRGYLKPGRKSINHEQAAIDAKVAQDIINKHTVLPPPRTSWAKVTKEANVDTSGYVTQGPSQFVIEKD